MSSLSCSASTPGEGTVRLHPRFDRGTFSRAVLILYKKVEIIHWCFVFLTHFVYIQYTYEISKLQCVMDDCRLNIMMVGVVRKRQAINPVSEKSQHLLFSVYHTPKERGTMTFLFYALKLTFLAHIFYKSEMNCATTS